MKDAEFVKRKEQETIFYTDLGKVIREFRHKAGITQDDLSYLFGISRVSVNNIENGKQRLPMHLIMPIFELFQIPLSMIPKFNYGIKSLHDLYEFKLSESKKALINKFKI